MVKKTIVGIAQRSSRTVEGAFRVTVDCGQSLTSLVAAGRYDWVNSEITAEHFPIEGRSAVEVEVILARFRQSLGTHRVLKELGRGGFRPARIEELLALGAQYPDLQHRCWIVALGSVWQESPGRGVVPCLCGDSRIRNLGGWVEDRRWSADWRFAAVRTYAVLSG